MFSLKSFVLLAVIAGTYGAPVSISKRIAQTISASTTKWEQACLTAGGGQQCNPLSITAFSALLAGGGVCDQQNAADQMIDLAKQLNNDPDMIKFTQIFVQQPRNTPDSLAVPYCQQAPQNAELNGLFQCQFQGANQKLFVGNVAVGGQGTIPFGLNAPVDPAGSCAANSNGPIADGSQLTDITDDPGVGATGGSNSTDSGDNSGDDSGSDSGDAGNDSGDSSDSGDDSGNTGDSGDDSGDSSDNSGDDTGDSSDNSGDDSGDASENSDAGSSTSSFALSNGQNAQQLNSQFAQLDASSSCQEGENACVNGQFAQCVSGAFVLQQCAASTQCFALPLVNSAGTSITCTTQSDALSRIAATGATGGLTGSN